MAVLTGALLGLSTLMFIGPVFFYLLKSSLEDGLKAGLMVAIGIIIGDILCVLLAIYGFGEVLSSPEYKKWIAGIGGILVLLFGINYVFLSGKSKKIKRPHGASLLKHGINGFLINFVNPFVFAVWFGFYAYCQSKFETKNQVITALLVTLSVILLTDVLKAYFANKLNRFITPSKLRIVFKIIGIIMIGFSIRLIFEFFR